VITGKLTVLPACTVIEMGTGEPPWSQQQFQEVVALFHIGTTKSHPPMATHPKAMGPLIVFVPGIVTP